MDIRRAWWKIGLGALVLLLWGGAVALSGSAAYRDLADVRTRLQAAEAALRDADLSTARDELGRATASAENARGRLHQPQFAPLQVLPEVGDTLALVRALAESAAKVGAAAGGLLDVADEIVHAPRVVADRGELPLEEVGRLRAPLRATAVALLEATARVDAAPRSRLSGRLEAVRRRFLAVAEPAAEQATVAAELAGVAGALFGADEPRRYLVLAASLSELRGSGGLLGAYTVLTADAGRLSYGTFADTTDRTGAPRDVAAPAPWFHERWAALGALRFWQNVNLSPHFPAVAETILRTWSAEGGDPLDGVIMTDPVTLQRVLERAGSIDVPGAPTLTADSALRFLGLEAYAAFGSHERRKQVLGDAAAGAFERLLDMLDDDDVVGSVDMLGSLVEGGHLKMYARDPVVQRVLERAGAAGTLPSGPGEVAAVVVNNVAGNKVDYFTPRRVLHRVTLQPGGVTFARVEVTFENRAPTAGYPRHVLGPWTDRTSAGDNLSYVTFLCGQGCEVTDAPGGAEERGTEGRLPASDMWLLVPAGGSRVAVFSTRTPAGWEDTAGGADVRVRHWRQPTVAAQELVIEVAVPPGFEPVGLPSDVEAVDGSVRWRGTGSSLVDLTIRFEPIEP